MHRVASGLKGPTEEEGEEENEALPRWELDFTMIAYEGLFGEYLEMSKSFCFV